MLRGVKGRSVFCLNCSKPSKADDGSNCTLVISNLTFCPLFCPLSSSSIRQYELVVHTDVNMSKVYTGEMGRLKSYENQKP